VLKMQIMSSFINRFFIKKRDIYSMDISNMKKTENIILENNENYSVKLINNEVYQKHFEFLSLRISKEKIQERMNNDNFLGVLILRKNDGEPIGYLWALVVDNKKGIWHDSFYLVNGEAILVNTFVNPNFRRQGFSHILKVILYKKIFNKDSTLKVYNIVENVNTASMKSNEKLGVSFYSKNYLVKFIGRNVFSIYRKNSR